LEDLAGCFSVRRISKQNRMKRFNLVMLVPNPYSLVPTAASYALESS